MEYNVNIDCVQLNLVQFKEEHIIMSKKLVAYFSASGVTADAARKITQVANADIYEICPEISYTAAVLNWQDKNSRSSVEMNDRTFRPAIADKNAKAEGYDVIFLGFPIWWFLQRVHSGKLQSRKLRRHHRRNRLPCRQSPPYPQCDPCDGCHRA